MDQVIHAIAEARRRAILQLVWDAEQPAGEIAAHFAVTRPAISQHLRVLKDAGLVTERRQGTRRLYRAVPARMAELRTFLEEFWNNEQAASAAAGPEDPDGSRWRRLRLRPG